MFYIPNMTGTPPKTKLFDSASFGARYRKERLALGKTQEDVARVLKCRRQTIAELERGGNVGVQTMFAALAALGKAVELVDSRYELDRLPNFMGDDT